MTKRKMTLKSLSLKNGSHSSRDDGMCVMEAVAYFANEPHSDKPQCACPVLTSFMIKVNDSMNDTERQLLKPYIKRLIGTRDGNSQKRLDILVRASVAVFAADTLRLTGVPNLVNHANILETVGETGTYAEMASAADAADAATHAAARAAVRSADAVARAVAGYAAWAARLAAESTAAYATYAAERAARAAEFATELAANRLAYWKKVLKTVDKALKVKGD